MLRPTLWGSVSEPTWDYRAGSDTIPHKVGPNKDVRDLSGGVCDIPI